MKDYNLQDPTDVDIMCSTFDFITEEEWEEYIQLAREKGLPYKQIDVLEKAQKKAGISKFLPKKMVKWVLNIKDQLEASEEDERRDIETQEYLQNRNFSLPPSHLTLRVAWHDNKWNGRICENPADNTYCNGFHSLLSDRIRRRKEKSMEQELQYAGKALNEIDYLPPCFWSINLFGEKKLSIQHDNPAAPDLKPLNEELNPQSILSWPFALSFTRTQKEQMESGSYPRNLQQTRVPRFSSKIHTDKSIAFMYAKFSNPLTEEEQQYLVVGAALVSKKQAAEDIPHFGPDSEIKKIQANPKGNFKLRNFPSMNWAMQFSLDPSKTVRMPYHEYLEEMDSLAPEAQEGFLDKIKVAITEPELEWCFKYVAMDIGDDEAIYILSKMRKALLDCKDDGVVSPEFMQANLRKLDQLLAHAWESRSYFTGFVSLSRIFLEKEFEQNFALEKLYNAFKEEIAMEQDEPEELLRQILERPKSLSLSQTFAQNIYELTDRIEQHGLEIEHFIQLSMLNLKPFQFSRILDGKLRLSEGWIKDFDETVKRSHSTKEIIENPYLLYEDYEYWTDSHDDVFGEERDAPIDLFKIDIAYFPHTDFQDRIEFQRQMKFADKRRIRALVLRHLKNLENKGHCFAKAEELQEAIRAYPLFYQMGSTYKIPEDLFSFISSDFANHFQNTPSKIKILKANDSAYYYLHHVYQAEKALEEKFRILLDKDELDDKYEDLHTYINNSLNKLDHVISQKEERETFEAERKELYGRIFSKKLFVLGGSAGSGKSHELLNIITYLEEKLGQKYLLLTPTGKAALRLSSERAFENIEASTIDKFLAERKSGKRSQSEIHAVQNLIIDETSMVDLIKFSELLAKFNFESPSFKRLILVGDPNQLPAIGFGRVLADLLEFLKSNPKYHKNFINLESNCRAELRGNKILDLANGFTQGAEIPVSLRKKFEEQAEQISTGFRARYWETKEELYQQIQEEFERLGDSENCSGTHSQILNQLLGLDKRGRIQGDNLDHIENFQILSPYHGQYSGSSRINDYFQSNFKGKGDSSWKQKVFKESDKLIRTKNYYKKNKLRLSNGTLGFLMDNKFKFGSSSGVEEIQFKEINKAEAEYFELAYAITVHKAQGSGFNHVFVVIPARYGLLSKELIYTALTRTKKSITLFLQHKEEAKRSVLDIAASRSFSGMRATSLMLSEPYRYYNLEPEAGIFVASRVELLIYHLLMKQRDSRGKENFNFAYEEKPIINGEEIGIKTDFTIYTGNKIWYWEHLGLLNQRKYTKTWKEIKTKTYQKAGIWDQVITTDEAYGINPAKIEQIIELVISDQIETEDEHKQYSNHHYYLR